MLRENSSGTQRSRSPAREDSGAATDSFSLPAPCRALLPGRQAADPGEALLLREGLEIRQSEGLGIGLFPLDICAPPGIMELREAAASRRFDPLDPCNL